MSETLQLYLIRHGETAWSITGQHTGFTDIALTPHGEDEARALAPCLRGIHFTRILTSPLRRARQTCDLAGLGAEGEIEPALVEWNYGDYEGKRTVDIRQGRPGWNMWRDGCPHGETPANISDRADKLLARLRALSGNVALFRTANLAQLSQRDGSDWKSSKLNTSHSGRHRSASLRMKPVTRQSRSLRYGMPVQDRSVSRSPGTL